MLIEDAINFATLDSSPHLVWRAIPQEPMRLPGVHIWQIDVAAMDKLAQRQLDGVLSIDEEHRRDRFKCDIARHEFVAGRVAMRAVLSRYLEIPAKQIEFAYGAWGKPAIRSVSPKDRPPLQFNITHSDGLALLAVTADGPVGIDLERIKKASPDHAAIASTYFDRESAALVAEAPTECQAEIFLRLWTQHEAILKALGIGIAGPTDGYTPPPVRSIIPRSGFVAAIAGTACTPPPT